MADKTNDINSTEKLLNAIRGKQEEVNGGNENNSISSSGKLSLFQRSKKLTGFFSDKRNDTVGVDIGPDFIYLAKATLSSDGSPIIIDLKIIKYDEKNIKDTTEFHSLLKNSINSICSDPDKCNIWARMSSDEVNVHHIKIPPVPKKQMEKAIYWAAKKETSFDEKDFIFDFEVQEDVIEQGIPKHSVMIYTAPIAEINKTKELFSKIGITLAGITMAPFATQNIYRNGLLPIEGISATLFIGYDYSQINIFNKDNLVMTRGIKTGISSMIEAITDSFTAKKGVPAPKKEETKDILFNLGKNSEESNEINSNSGLLKEEIFTMLIPAIERLTRQIERTIQYFTSTTLAGQERVEKLYISSTIEIYNPILDYIGEQLGIKIELFDPLKNQTEGGGMEAIPLADRMALIRAMGLSLSSNQRTPNFIFTYKERNNEINIKKINRAMFAIFAAVMVICILTITYQAIDTFALTRKKTILKKEISAFNPLISEERVIKLANDLKTQRNISRQYADRYLGMAIIAEVSALTPENIRLNNLKINMQSNSIPKDKIDKTAKDDAALGVTLEGIITGDRSMLDAYLAQYIVKLSNSPILHQVSVNKNSIVNFKKDEVLQFVIGAKIGK